MREKLKSFELQIEHSNIDKEQGELIIQDLRERYGFSNTKHIRTAEYSVFSAWYKNQKVLLRMGLLDTSFWHEEEAQMAKDWNREVASVLAPTDFLITNLGTISIWPWVEHDNTDYALAGKTSGSVLKQMHGLKATPVFQERGFRAPGKIARRLINIENSYPEQIDFIRQVAEELAIQYKEILETDFELGCIHGDYTPGNWLIQKDQLHVVDFATSGYGPKMWDLSLLSQRCGPELKYDSSLWFDFCKGYGVEADILDGTAIYRFRELSSVIANLKLGDFEKAKIRFEGYNTRRPAYLT